MKASRDKSSWAWFRKPTRRAARGKTTRRPKLFYGLGFEPLEGRILLSHDVPDVLTVGRTLSSWSVAGVRNNELTITYSVYNQQADPVSGVLLTDTLRPGVTFKSASVLPDRNGQELAWGLGTLEPFGRASVELTVTLTTPLPLQLDTGAQAFGTLNAGMVTDAAPAATLRTDALAPEFLASTPDANTNDPFLQAKAAELDYDPQRIFDFLNTDIGYESYVGSLRGARGTLWSSAGNSLDEASLGVAFYRASGIPARYAHGTLSDPQAKQLILTMFPAGFQTVGYIPAGTEVADPANDPKLLSETRSHYWLQIDTGSGFQNADTSGLGGTAIGTAYTTVSDTFATVADNLRHKVRVTLDAEIYSQASALFAFGNGLGTKTVLDHTFNAVDLVGRPLSIGHFVNTTEIGALVFASRTTTYSPYLIVGDAALELGEDEVLRGQDYQEVLTNFPLGTQVVSGVFLRVALDGPDGPTERFERPLADRIGFAARAGFQLGGVTVAPGGPPLLSPVDIATLDILAGLSSPKAAGRFAAQVRAAQAELTRLVSELGPSAAADDPRVQAANRQVIVALQRERLAALDNLSDAVLKDLASVALSAAYFDRPRITIMTSRLVEDPTTPGNGRFVLQIDLRRDRIRVLAAPGQNARAAVALKIQWGIMQNLAEREALRPAAATGSNLQVTDNTAAIFLAAQEQNIDILPIDAANRGMLATMRLSPEAQARVTDALDRGKVVLLPEAPVMIGGVEKVAWFESDPVTGDTVGVTEDGGHAITVSQIATNVLSAILTSRLTYAFLIGLIGIPLLTPADLAALPFLGVGVLALTAGGLGYAIGVLFFGAIGLLLGWAAKIRFFDPPIPDGLVAANGPARPASAAAALTRVVPGLPSGALAGDLSTRRVTARGDLTASWVGSGADSFLVATLHGGRATVTDAAGVVRGTGPIRLTTTRPTFVSVTGGPRVDVRGRGSLSYYADATANLGVGGEWENYTADLTGDVTARVTTDALTLDGVLLPPGTYTLTTDTATLTGRGATSSPTFAGTATATATGATVEVGPGAGTATAGGSPLDPRGGFTLTGYSGTLAVTAGGTTDAVALGGNAAHVVSLGVPPAVTADQNTPATFSVDVRTSLADDFRLTAEAPAGWRVSLDDTGRVTATPAPGLQGGTFPVRLVARSQASPDLVAAAEVLVTVLPTAPGVALSVDHDPVFTVPYNGAQSPTAFTASVRNLGPTADTFHLSFSGVPAGFEVVTGGPTVAVPAGQAGVRGIYLRPTGGGLPSPGTPLSFTVTAISATNPALTATRTVTFTMPAVHGLTVVADPAGAGTTPGAPISGTLTLRAIGNVAETVTLSTALPAGLTLTGLPPTVTLQPGASVVLPFTLTPSGSTPLNSTLTATITAQFNPLGEVFDQTVRIPVRVAVPGADAIADASVAAGQLGNPNLANRLNDLSTALTNLVQTPENAVFRGQAVAALDAVRTLAAVNPYLAAVLPALAADRVALDAATTGPQVQAAVSRLGDTLGDLGTTLADEVEHRFTLEFVENTAVAQPQVPATFSVLLRNVGTQTTTYDLSVSELPTGVTAAFSQDSVILAPGQSTFTAGNPNLTVTVTPGAGEIVPFGFEVRATARPAPAIARTVAGSFTARRELVSVVAVTPAPAFTDPGSQVVVSARVLNAVNREQAASVTYVVKDAGGVTRFTSLATSTTLTVATGLLTVNLGNLDTTGFANGDYTITVTVSDAQGQPIPGATGTGHLLVGTPVSATLTSGPETLPSGTGTVTNTLVIGGRSTSVGPLGVVSVTELPGAGGVVKNGRYVYASGTTGIRVFDITNPSNPQLIRTFGSGATNLEIRGDKLYALSFGGPFGRFPLTIYSLTDPESPQLLGTAKHNNADGIPYSLAWNMVVTDTHVFVSLWSTTHLIGNPQDIKYQTGDVIAIDVTNPAAPVFVSALLNTYGTNSDGIERFLNVDVSCGDGNLWEIVQVNANTLLVAGSTARGDNTQSGSGVVHVVDISNPARMAIVRTLTIPGTVQAVGLSIEGNRAFVAASQGGWNDPAPSNDADLTGNLVLATLDISDPRNPVLIHSAVQNRSSVGPYSLHTIPLGNGLFAFSSQGNGQEESALFLVDANNPTNLITSRTTIPAINAFGDLEGEGNFLYSTSPSGLIIYQIDAPDAIPATARVTVPTADGVTVVPGSFSLTPTRTSPAAGGTTFEWDLSLGSTRTITWQSTVTNVQPGQSRVVTTDGSVSFTSQGTNGEVALADQFVTGAQIIGLTPTTRTTAPGAAAGYTVRLSNPTAAAVTYTLAVPGVPAGWVGLAPTVNVPANGTTDVPLTLTSDAFTAVGEYGFTVTVAGSNGAASSVQGDLVLQGNPAPTDPEARGVVVTLSPAQATAGQGTSVTYVVRVTNTGSAADTFTLTTDLPADFTTAFERATVEVPPGASNFREVTLTVTPRVGTAAGATSFQVTAVSTAHADVSDRASGTITVLAAGVAVQLTPNVGDPGGTFSLTVTNTGQATDTFDLALAGPVALVATLGVTLVTLAPNQSQAVPISVGAIDFAFPGTLALAGTTTSRADPAVTAAARAEVRLAGTRGLGAAFQEDTVTLPQPGPASFLLLVNNTGNIEDEYTATITGTDGPITASLLDLDGRPTRTVPLFLLPGLSTGALLLRTDQAAAGRGTVTVEVRSRTDGRLVASDTAVVTTAGQGRVSGTLFLDYSADGAPGAGEPVLPGRTVFLDADGDGALTPGEPTAVTDAAGRYEFADLAPGSYTLRQTFRPYHGVVQSGPSGGGHTFTVTGGDTTDRGFGNVFVSQVSPVEVAADPPPGPDDAATSFVRRLYRNLLGRDADAAGLASWADLVRAGNGRAAREAVVAGLWRSAEHRGVQVDHYYRTFLERAADPAGRAYWVNRLADGAGEADVVLGFLTSDEYRAARPDPASFARGLYDDVLSREGGDAELAYWEEVVTRAGHRAVARAFVNSDESSLRIIDGYYAVLLHRPGEEQGRRYWLDTLRAGQATAESPAGAVGESFLFLDEYFGRTG